MNNLKNYLVNETVQINGTECHLALVLDTRNKSKLPEDAKFPLCIRYTVNRIAKYYKLPFAYSENAFYALLTDVSFMKERTNAISQYYKHKEIIESLSSYDNIKAELDKWNGKNKQKADAEQAKKELSFIKVWENIIKQKGVGTADSYSTALKSFQSSVAPKYNRKVKGFDVDKDTIHNWVQFMTDKGLSKTTIGVYLRACRVVWNTCIKIGCIEQGNYPFSKNEIQIPTGAVRKHEFLTIEQMTELYNTFITKNYNPKWNRTYTDKVNTSLGLFLVQYLGNGFNLSDVARLRYNDYYYTNNGKAFQFYRQKTKERNEAASEVIIPIIEPLQNILNELASEPEKNERVFPFILDGAKTEIEIKKRISQENSNIKDRVIAVAKWLGWSVEPSGTWARHSFATNLSRCGVPNSYISESMGHSMQKYVTLRYIADYPIEQQIKYNNMLLNLKQEDKKHDFENMEKEQLIELNKQLLEQIKQLTNQLINN